MRLASNAGGSVSAALTWCRTGSWVDVSTTRGGGIIRSSRSSIRAASAISFRATAGTADDTAQLGGGPM